ncbi:MAG: hypothetical protein II502_00750, partial [Paludibacteraceae bacterium]|nr:hypothetical protein [Paludibacteraceae bacterium]
LCYRFPKFPFQILFQIILHIRNHTHQLNDKGIGVEVVAFNSSLISGETLLGTQELKLTKAVGSILTFETKYSFGHSGGVKLGLRMFPKHELLPHRMDFAYVKWL